MLYGKKVESIQLSGMNIYGTIPKEFYDLKLKTIEFINLPDLEGMIDFDRLFSVDTLGSDLILQNLQINF